MAAAKAIAAAALAGACITVLVAGLCQGFNLAAPYQYPQVCAAGPAAPRSNWVACRAGRRPSRLAHHHHRRQQHQVLLSAQAQDQVDETAPAVANSSLHSADSGSSGDGEVSEPAAAVELESAAKQPTATATPAAAELDWSEADQAAAALATTEPGGEAEPVRKVRRVKKFFARDFANSTWAIAILWGSDRKVQATKVFLRDDGKVVWLDGGKGSWRLDTRSRSLGFYRDFPLGLRGKRIFSTRLLDNCNEHYLEGDIKGWGPWFPLKWMGQWQAVRLGVELDKFGPAPWLDREAPEDMVAVEENYEV